MKKGFITLRPVIKLFLSKTLFSHNVCESGTRFALIMIHSPVA